MRVFYVLQTVPYRHQKQRFGPRPDTKMLYDSMQYKDFEKSAMIINLAKNTY